MGLQLQPYNAYEATCEWQNVNARASLYAYLAKESIMVSPSRICCIGAGYVGGVPALVARSPARDKQSA